MAQVAGLVLFILAKTAEWILIGWFAQKFQMRLDTIALGFWGGLSLFQFLFLALQTLTGNKKGAYHSSLVFQYTTIITILMDFVILVMTGYYLYLLENALFNLLLVLVGLSSILAWFYILHSMVFTSVIRKHKILVSKPSLLPTFLFLIYSFYIPIFYLLAF